MRIWSSRCAPRGLQRICLFLDHACADDLVDRGFHERGGDDLAGAVALPVVGDGRGVRGEVPAELADHLGEFVVPVLVVLAAGVLVFEVGGDVVDGLQRAEDVAVPQKPFQRCSSAGEGGRQLGWDAQALGQLNGDAHREVEPVQQRTKNQELRDQLARHLGAARVAAVTRRNKQS